MNAKPTPQEWAEVLAELRDSARRASAAIDRTLAHIEKIDREAPQREAEARRRAIAECQELDLQNLSAFLAAETAKHNPPPHFTQTWWFPYVVGGIAFGSGIALGIALIRLA